MKNTALIALAGMALMLLTAGCTAPPGTGPETPIITPTVTTTCGFTTCHGLDLACGSNPPEACTTIYMLGDKCRQYAYCTSAGGTCTLVKTAAFDECKKCVDQCSGGDITEMAVCEEKC